VSEEANRKFPAKNTLVQLLHLYCTPTLNAAMHSVSAGQTDDIMMPIADHTV